MKNKKIATMVLMCLMCTAVQAGGSMSIFCPPGVFCPPAYETPRQHEALADDDMVFDFNDDLAYDSTLGTRILTPNEVKAQEKHAREAQERAGGQM